MLDLDSNISQSGIIAQISLFVKHYLIIIHFLTKKDDNTEFFSA